MSNISETLRATILSLKQISDRVKSVINNLGTFSSGITVSSKLNSIESKLNTVDNTVSKESTLTQGITDIRADISAVAKQGSNANATNTAIYDRIGDVDEVLEYIAGGSVDEVIDSYTAEYAEEIDLMIGDWSENNEE